MLSERLTNYDIRGHLTGMLRPSNLILIVTLRGLLSTDGRMDMRWRVLVIRRERASALWAFSDCQFGFSTGG